MLPDRVSNPGYTMVCPPVQDNPQALASGLSAVQADKLWYNYFIPPSSVQILLIALKKYSMLKLAFCAKSGIMCI